MSQSSPQALLANTIILSLDHPKWSDAFADAKAFKKLGGTWVKVNPIHLITEGYGIIKALKSLGLDIFTDSKYFNTEYVIGRTAEQAIKHKPDMLNMAAASGEAAMRAFSLACQNKGCLSIAVTVLTTISSRECFKTYRRGSEAQVMLFAKQAAQSGMDGVVCSGEELKAIRADPVTEHLLTVVPGIRNLQDSNGDQSRVMTPYQAIQLGADYLVIGSSLIKGNLIANWERTVRLYEQEFHEDVPF